MIQPHIAWLETTLWQRVCYQGLDYEAQGRYLSGPEHRIRLDLTTQVGATPGKLHLVSDGSTVWKAQRIGPGDEWMTVTRVTLGLLFATLPPGAALEQVRDEFLRGESFGGVHALMTGLRRQMTWVRRELVRRNGRDFIKLTGVGSGEVLPELSGGSSAQRPAPAQMPALPGPTDPVAAPHRMVGCGFAASRRGPDPPDGVPESGTEPPAAGLLPGRLHFQPG